jgi:3-oxoacyl-[acyl-carrier protein] reductase
MTDRVEERSFSLEGDVVLITGAVRGIGGAVVKRFVDDGARVGFTYRPSDRNRGYAADLVASVSDPDRVLALEADVRSVDQTQAAVARLVEHFGKPIDVAIANAARGGKLPWDEITYDDWDEVLDINLKGSFILARAVIDGMREQGYGKIITVGSVMANTGDPRSLHYVSSKGGIVSFTRSLARAEGKHGIRVNCVIPGAIQIEKEAEAGADAAKTLEWMQQVQCLMYRGQTEDITGAFHFLASHASDFITGQVLEVDGGWHHY